VRKQRLLVPGPDDENAMIEPEHTTKYKKAAHSDGLQAILEAELARLHGWWDRLVMAYVKWHVSGCPD
jgi:hypothetical protein